MFDQNFVERLAQALVARMLPQIQNGGNGNGNGSGSKPVPPVLKRVFTVKECAIYIGRSETAAYRLVAKRQIPCVRNGRTLKFLRDDLVRWLEGDKV
jgi:excisionase family DNA binding protein